MSGLSKPAATERQIHKSVFDALMLAKQMKWLRCVCFPVPNGAANLGPKVGGMLKAWGMVYPGVSDWVFLTDSSNLGVELKTTKGEQNEDQVAFQEWCEGVGVPYRIARSLDEVLDLLSWHGMITVAGHNKLLGR